MAGIETLVAGSAAAANAALPTGAHFAMAELIGGGTVAGFNAASAAPVIGAAGTAGGGWAALNALGHGLSGAGTILTGVHSRAVSREEAKEYERIASEERAAGQRKAQETRRKMNLLLSRSQAVSAASGAGPTDPSVLTNEGDIFQEGEYQANVESYQGESRAAGYEGRAERSRQRGDDTMVSSILGGTGTILSGVGSYYDKYGRRQPERYRYDWRD